MRTEHDTDNTFREVEDFMLSLVFGDGVILDEEIDFAYLSIGISEAIPEVLNILVGEQMRTFKIRRTYAPHLNRSAEDVEGKVGLTEEEAQEHCSNPDTREPGEWFDVYVAE